jgi:cardiolipin synthase
MALEIGLGIVIFFGVVIWSIKRHRDPALRIDFNGSIRDVVPSLAGLTLGSASEGNAVNLLENGSFFDALLGEIEAAKRSVHFETFLWKEGRLGERLADALAGRARAGVNVRVLLDANGSRRMGKDAERRLRDSGCKLAKFHPWRPWNIGVFNERDHRKIAVIDGRVAFVGGHCIVDEWLGNAEDECHFGDVSLRLRGPIVNVVQGAFSENWVGETGELFVGDDVFPKLEPEGDVTIHAAFLKPENSAPAVKIHHHAAICCARKRLWIQNPYFIPEPAAIDAMGEAVARGVDVRVLMPATSGSDNPMVQHAGHRNFEKMLRCGVRLFEYPKTLLHQKVMTIDGAWCSVGSSNFDDRSFETNDEIALGVLDADLAQKLDAIFEKYARHAQEVKLDDWKRRPLVHKLVDQVLYGFNEVL